MTEETAENAERGAELLPCPFCGCDELQYEGDGVLYWLSCPKCFACSPVVDSEAEVAPAWNKRLPRPTTDTVERAAVDRAIAAVSKRSSDGYISFAWQACSEIATAIRALPSATGGEVDTAVQHLISSISIAKGLAVALESARHEMQDCSLRRGINDHLAACMEKLSLSEQFLTDRAALNPQGEKR